MRPSEMPNFDYIRGPQGAPCREQNLLISPSKHMYLTKDEALRYQKKPIEPRLPGAKTLLTRLVLLDVDTGTFYGEMHIASNLDILGFLARAWSFKPDHPMHGFPKHLNTPQIAFSDPDIDGDINFLQAECGFSRGHLPSGFAGGIHALKNYEAKLDELRRHSDHDYYLAWVFKISALVSRMASSSMSPLWDKKWAEVPAPGPRFTQFVDEAYEEPGAWRTDEYEPVLVGF